MCGVWMVNWADASSRQARYGARQQDLSLRSIPEPTCLCPLITGRAACLGRPHAGDTRRLSADVWQERDSWNGQRPDVTADSESVEMGFVRSRAFGDRPEL